MSEQGQSNVHPLRSKTGSRDEPPGPPTNEIEAIAMLTRRVGAVETEIRDMRAGQRVGFAFSGIVLTLFSVLAAVLLGVFLYEGQRVDGNLSALNNRLDQQINREADREAVRDAATNARLDRILDAISEQNKPR